MEGFRQEGVARLEALSRKISLAVVSESDCRGKGGSSHIIRRALKMGARKSWRQAG